MTNHSESSATHGAITAVVCLALAAVVAAMSSLNVALPDIARDTHASQTQLVWVIAAGAAFLAALTVIVLLRGRRSEPAVARGRAPDGAAI